MYSLSGLGQIASTVSYNKTGHVERGLLLSWRYGKGLTVTARSSFLIFVSIALTHLSLFSDLKSLLLLRQLTRRLGWITTENDPPQKSGIIAERLLVGLAKEPQTMLREDLVKTILSLNPPLLLHCER